MRTPTKSVLSLLLLAAPLAHLAAAAAQQSQPPPPHPRVGDATPQTAPWRRLQAAVVSSIWGDPEQQLLRSLDAHRRPKADASGAGAPGADLLARYGEDIVMRFTLRTPAEAAALAEAASVLVLDVWEFNQDWADIRIAKAVVPSLLGLLPAPLQTAHVSLMQDRDLAQAVFDSYPAPSPAQQPHEAEGDRLFSPSLAPPAASQGNPFFHDYQPLSVMLPWMDLMASMYRTHVRRITVGISYEGRDIPALRVGVHPTNDAVRSAPRKTILVTGGSHAREWISTSTVNYLASSLITSYGKDHTVTRMLEAFDFVFVPTLNPDGYAYSWETDRLWRKNRQPTSLRFCQGIDLDRSYPYMWDVDSTRSNPCSESFAGDNAFDAVEARRFADWAKNETENNNVDFYGLLDLHSYSQSILYPYSFSCDLKPPTVEDLEELGLGLAKAIRTSPKGRPYKVSSACEGNVAMSSNSEGKKERILFPQMESTGGSALDWFYHELKVKYAYQIKLRDRGTYGFLLPRENIIPTGEEVVGALHYLGHFLLGEVGFMGVEAVTPTHPDEAVEPAETTANMEQDQDSGDDASMFELRRRR